MTVRSENLARVGLPYVPAELKHNERGFYIEYFVFNPGTGKNDRVRKNLNVLRKKLSLQDFKRQASIMICDLNAKLASGWSPFSSAVNQMQYVSLESAFEDFFCAKNHELRATTIANYRSVVKILLEYLELMRMRNCMACSFTHMIAIRFMDYLGTDVDYTGKHKKALNNNGWNTYKKKYMAIFGWLVERGYILQNPFEKIRDKPKMEKTRIQINEDVRPRIMEYMAEHNPGFILVLHLIYTGLIRPKEIRLLRISDVDMKRHCIRVSADVAKTHRERFAPMSEELYRLLDSMHLERYPLRYYLIGHQYEPAAKGTYTGQLKKDWERMRSEMGIPKEMQLYSWKDSGISDMFDAGLDALTIQTAAGHADLATTSKYAKLNTKKMIANVWNGAPPMVQQ